MQFIVSKLLIESACVFVIIIFCLLIVCSCNSTTNMFTGLLLNLNLYYVYGKQNIVFRKSVQQNLLCPCIFALVISTFSSFSFLFLTTILFILPLNSEILGLSIHLYKPQRNNIQRVIVRDKYVILLYYEALCLAHSIILIDVCSFASDSLCILIVKLITCVITYF